MIRAVSVLRSSALVEYSLWWNALLFVFQTFCEILKWWPCSAHQLQTFASRFCGPELICNYCNYWLFSCSVIWPDSNDLRLPSSLSGILLTIAWVSAIVTGSWSGDVVAKRCAGPNTPFCRWRSWYDSRKLEKQCVIREVCEQPLGFFFFFCKGAAWCDIKSDQGVVACSMLLEAVLIWFTGLWSQECKCLSNKPLC